jgi:hypothetical protein
MEIKNNKLKSYLDLKVGDTLRFSRLELNVSDICREDLYLRIITDKEDYGVEVKKGKAKMITNLQIHNFGKGCGRRNHALIIMPKYERYSKY